MFTRLEKELELAKSLVADLEAKVSAEAKVRTKATNAQMRLAAALHDSLCPKDHTNPAECNWELVVGKTDPSDIDWTLPQPEYWLKITQTGLIVARDLGFGITEPDNASAVEAVEVLRP
jgi:hypothetical protein